MATSDTKSMKKLQKIYHWLYPPHGYSQDPEQEISIRLLFFTCISLSLLFFIFSMNYLFSGDSSIAAIQMIVSVIAISAWFVFRKTKSVTLSANFIMFFGAISGFLRAKMMGGIASPAFIVWPIIPVFTVILMPALNSAFWTALYIGYAVYFDWAAQQGIVFPTKLSMESLSKVRIFAIILVDVVCFAVVLYFKNVSMKYRKIIQKQKEEKANLVRVLSHDLSTPLSVLTLSLDLQARFPDKAQSVSEKMNRAIESIRNILSQVRELESVDSGKTQLEISPVRLQEVLEEIRFLQSQKFLDKNLDFVVDFQVSSDVKVLAEKSSLTYQVLNNLVSNAIKFSDPGSMIKLTISEENNSIFVQIKDAGVGIPADLLGSIFDPKKQTTRDGTQGEKGTGFGMPIVRSYIERFGAHIQVESKTKQESSQDHGTTVTLKFEKAA